MNGDAWLPALTAAESQTLLNTTGARLGLDFDAGDLDALGQAAGGHPFLLRQLGSQVARLAGRPDPASASRVFQPGEWPRMPALEGVPAETAIQAYLQQRSDSLVHLWRALPPEVRRNVRLLAADHPLDPALEPAYTTLGLLAADDGDRPRLRIGLLGRWLRERRL